MAFKGQSDDMDAAVENIAAALGGQDVTDTDTPAEGQKAPRLLDDDTTRGITDIQTALAALKAAGVVAEKASTYDVLDNKDELVGKDMVLLQWRFNDGDMGPFVSIEAVTADNRKVVINDRSTGIYAQLKSRTEKLIAAGVTPAAAHAGIHANTGLRRSDFMYTDAEGKERPAKTYYVAGLPIPKK